MNEFENLFDYDVQALAECVTPGCKHRRYWHGTDGRSGACTKLNCPCKEYTAPSMQQA